jgi:hypothetical protein
MTEFAELPFPPQVVARILIDWAGRIDAGPRITIPIPDAAKTAPGLKHLNGHAHAAQKAKEIRPANPAPTMMTSRSSIPPLSVRFASIVLIWSHSFEDSRAMEDRPLTGRGANLRARTGSISGVTTIDVEDMAVMNDASSDAMKTIALASSSERPRRSRPKVRTGSRARFKSPPPPTSVVSCRATLEPHSTLRIETPSRRFPRLFGLFLTAHNGIVAVFESCRATIVGMYITGFHSGRRRRAEARAR